MAQNIIKDELIDRVRHIDGWDFQVDRFTMLDGSVSYVLFAFHSESDEAEDDFMVDHPDIPTLDKAWQLFGPFVEECKREYAGGK